MMKLPKPIKEEIAHYQKTRVPRCPHCKKDMKKIKSTKLSGKEIASEWINDCKCVKRNLRLMVG